MKTKIGMAAQFLLGLIFLVFGLGGLFNLLPQPEMGAKAAALMGGFAESGYFFPLLKITEAVAGLLLVVRAFAPLALILLAPIVVQILAFHIFLEPGGLVMAAIVVLLEAYLGFVVYRDRFKSVLAFRS